MPPSSAQALLEKLGMNRPLVTIDTQRIFLTRDPDGHALQVTQER